MQSQDDLSEDDPESSSSSSQSQFCAGKSTNGAHIGSAGSLIISNNIDDEDDDSDASFDLHAKRRVHPTQEPPLEKKRKLHSRCSSTEYQKKSKLSNQAFDQAKIYAREKGGQCLNFWSDPQECMFKFQCANKHTWNSWSLKWCQICEKAVQDASIFAQQNNGFLHSTVFDRELKFECNQGHSWSHSYNEPLKWCNICEKKLKEDELINEQRQLFQQARQEAQKNPLPNVLQSAENFTDSRAREMTNRYMSSYNYKGECKFDQAFLVYKILCSTPQFLMHRYFMKYNLKDDLAADFRTLAKKLHPDKNRHPSAREAFTKISQVYSFAMRS